MLISPIVTQSYIRAFPIETKRTEKSRLDISLNERENDKAKPEEEEKRNQDLAVA